MDSDFVVRVLLNMPASSESHNIEPHAHRKGIVDNLGIRDKGIAHC